MRVVVALLLFGPASAFLGAAPSAKLEFNRDIRPILSENCFQCHGQDAKRRESKLRLDELESVRRDRGGYFVIDPGKPDESDLITRINSADPDEVMPPPDSHKRLTAEQKTLLRDWIAQGAEYERPWAFVPPRRPAVPVVGVSERGSVGVRDSKPSISGTPSLPHSDTVASVRNPIDAFILARLEREKLAPSPAAAPATWLRRVSFDLTGLPPTPAELDRFTAETSVRGEAAYVAAVDRLLGSAHFGERQAMEWLDAARYADTHGFNNDSARAMWRWRDWVIEAFNRNLPYDQFITEQLAGDLLPQPTLEQRIATGFNRNHVINSEGGIIDEEYRVEYVADRVRTTSTAWLGLTLECARCHDHKFDAVTQRDYYRFFAFFNSVPEHGEDGRVANAVPFLPAPTREQQAALAKQEGELATLDRQLNAARDAWRWQASDDARLETIFTIAKRALDGDRSATAVDTTERIASKLLDFQSKDGVTLAFWLRPADDNPRDVALFSALDHLGSPADANYGGGREVRLIDGEIELTMSARLPVYAAIVRTTGAQIRPGEWRHVAVSYAGGQHASAVRCFVDGVEIPTRALYDGLNREMPLKDFLIGSDNTKDGPRWRGELRQITAFARALPGDAARGVFLAQALPAVREALRDGTATPRQTEWARETLLGDAAATAEIATQRRTKYEALLALRRSLPTTMVMEELPTPRPTFLLDRGRYDAPKDPVEPGVPETLIAPWPEGAPRNRLGLARWFTQPNHPLTSRVVVNRLWAQFFGTGLVKTLEDFGAQGEPPSHPELLDWLAREFVDSGWNVKALCKLIVLSSTYRQASAISPTLLARDPENRLLARGPRGRLPAELIRDQALVIGGLLSPRLGGPSVYPPQPEKLYDGIVVGANYPGTTWGESSESDQHRRSLYTFLKRTVPHPAMIAFDAPDREVCVVRRARTNTPLQALTLWNEPGFVEAARALGTRLLREAPGDEAARIGFAFQAATGRKPRADEVEILATAFEKLRVDFAAHPADAEALLKVGPSAADAGLPPAELAAATSVASMILNLDETLTKN